MAGGRGLELSLACAAPSPAADFGEEEEELRRPPSPRRRRQQPTMAALYAELAALLPGLRSRASREEIVEAAAKQVKVLEDTVAVLEAYRAVQVGGAAAAEEVSVSYRETVCFAARLPAARRPGALTRVLEVFDRRGVEVLAATLAGGGRAAMVTVTAAAAAPDIAEMIKADIASIE
uniref:BHLH domain-containing protein n=1 Tax=Oryza nivara TaxID=4536 RepID=A0A0E0FNX2_ORYNI